MFTKNWTKPPQTAFTCVYWLCPLTPPPLTWIMWPCVLGFNGVSVQILLIFLQKMDLLLTKTPAEDIKNSVLPMVYRALEAPSVQIQVRLFILFISCFYSRSFYFSSCWSLKVIFYFERFSILLSVCFSDQELCLNIIPTFANLIDYPSMKNSLIPRIKSACLQTSSLAVSLSHVIMET